MKKKILVQHWHIHAGSTEDEQKKVILMMSSKNIAQVLFIINGDTFFKFFPVTSHIRVSLQDGSIQNLSYLSMKKHLRLRFSFLEEIIIVTFCEMNHIFWNNYEVNQ